MEPIKLEAEPVLAEQVRILLGRLMEAEARASRAEAAANLLAARLAPPDAPPDE